jgi:hypothetical protein
MGVNHLRVPTRITLLPAMLEAKIFSITAVTQLAQ